MDDTFIPVAGTYAQLHSKLQSAVSSVRPSFKSRVDLMCHIQDALGLRHSLTQTPPTQTQAYSCSAPVLSPTAPPLHPSPMSYTTPKARELQSQRGMLVVVKMLLAILSCHIFYSQTGGITALSMVGLPNVVFHLNT